jgi:hypothetical protein
MTKRVPTDHEQQRAFEKTADGLGFTTRHTSFEVGEHTDIGLLLGPLASPVVEFDDGASPVAAGPDDDAAIEALITSWEHAGPDELKTNMSAYATEHMLLILSDAIGKVSDDAFEGDDDLLAHMDSYPLHSPRQVTITNLSIVHIGGSRAAVTYTFDEQFTDGTSIHSNAVAIAVKLGVGWRLALATDHLDS